MQVNVQEDIKKNADLAAAVDEATKMLEEGKGPTGEQVTVDWSLGQDGQNGTRIDLKITHPEVSVAGRFTPEELKNRDRMEARLNRLWDDLLRERIRKQMARVRQVVQELEGD